MGYGIWDMGLRYGIGMGLWQMGWDKWDLGWDLGGMGYGILPSQLIWAASIVVTSWLYEMINKLQQLVLDV